MEFTAASLASQMDKLWKRDLIMELQDSVFWTDSTVVLKYIQNETSRFRCFVANGVAEILRTSNTTPWKYVNSSINPAEFTSSGLRVRSLLKEQMWIAGSPFLFRSQEEWPTNPVDVEKIMLSDPEIKKEFLANTLQIEIQGLDAVTRFIYLGEQRERGVSAGNQISVE